MTVRNTSMRHLRSGAIAGVVATVAMDIGGRAVARVVGEPPVSPVMLGRWTRHVAQGRVRHDDINAASPHRSDAVIGAATHYAIGATLGAGYARAGGAERGLVASTSYGAATTAFAWFFLFPSMGLGVLGRNSGPHLARLSFANHLLFGAALGIVLGRQHPDRDLR